MEAIDVDVVAGAAIQRGRRCRGKGHVERRRALRLRGPRGGCAVVSYCRPVRHGFRSYGRAALLSCCSRVLRGTTGFADVATWDFGADLESPGGMSADSPQACVGAAPGRTANPNLDSVTLSAVLVDDTRWFVISNDVVARAPSGDVLDVDTRRLIISDSLVATPPGLHLLTTTTGTTGDDCDYEAPNYYYSNHYYYYTPLPLYRCAQGDPMPRAVRECSPIFGGHSAGRGGALGFGLRGGTLGGGSGMWREQRHRHPKYFVDKVGEDEAAAALSSALEIPNYALALAVGF